MASNDAEAFGIENGGPNGDVKRGLLEMTNGGMLFFDAADVLAQKET